MNLAIINNSNNPDMVEYFKNKKSIKNKNIIFLSNKESISKDEKISSFSKVNGLSFYFFIDCLWSIYICIYLKTKSIKFILFDTAHISNIPTALLAKIFGIKIIFTIHDWVPHEGNESFKVKLYNNFVIKFLAYHLIVFSKINTNLPHTIFRLGGFKQNVFNENPEKKYFLFFGRIEPYKGIDNLVKIADILKITMPNAFIKVVGRGKDPNLNILKTKTNVDLYNKFIHEDELDKYIKDSQSVILPYKSATQSGVIIKSFSLGVPVVCFDVGSLSEYVEHGHDGFIVSKGDIKKFVAEMKNSSLKRSQLNKNIVRSYRAKYSKEAFVSQYEFFINNLVK